MTSPTSALAFGAFPCRATLVDDLFLFTGDSLCWRPASGALHAFRQQCWYSWSEQKRSLDALTSYDFERVFAGHGSWSPRLDVPTMRARLKALVDSM